MLRPIQSNNVRAADYDGMTYTLTLQFHEGRVYDYLGVPLDVWPRFLAAQPHPWSAMRREIQSYECIPRGYPA